MKKTKKSKSKSKYLSTKYRPVVIPKATTDLFLKLPPKDRANAMALYWFYYSTATWQKTNQPHCTDTFVAGIDKERERREGLGWNVEKIARIRKILEGMGLIEKIRDGITGKTYIKINFYHSKEVVRDAELRTLIEEIVGFQVKNQDKEIRLLRELLLKSLDKNYVFSKQEKSQIKKAKQGLPCIDMTAKSGKSRVCYKSPENQTPEKPNSGKTRLNAYNNNKLNAYKNNIVTGEAHHRESSLASPLLEDKSKKSFYIKCSIKLEKAIRENRKICRKVNIKQWSVQFRNLKVKSGIKEKRIGEVLLWYCAHFGEEFVPVAYSAKTFCDKFLRIEDARERAMKKTEPKKSKYSGTKSRKVK